jgi:hypothetical protein
LEEKIEKISEEIFEKIRRMSLETLEPSQVKKNTQETRENVVQTPEPSSDERDPVLIPCNYLGLANPQVQENFLEKNCSPARINADDIT